MIARPQLSLAEAAESQRAAIAGFTAEEWTAMNAAWRALKPRIDPALTLLDERVDGAAYAAPGGLRVIVSVSPHGGHMWAHVSASYATALPGWAIMKRVKRWVLGADAKAIIVLAPDSEHVNVHPHVHHLWCCLSGDVLPDFTLGSRSI